MKDVSTTRRAATASKNDSTHDTSVLRKSEPAAVQSAITRPTCSNSNTSGSESSSGLYFPHNRREIFSPKMILLLYMQEAYERPFQSVGDSETQETHRGPKWSFSIQWCKYSFIRNEF